MKRFEDVTAFCYGEFPQGSNFYSKWAQKVPIPKYWWKSGPWNKETWANWARAEEKILCQRGLKCKRPL